MKCTLTFLPKGINLSCTFLHEYSVQNNLPDSARKTQVLPRAWAILKKSVRGASQGTKRRAYEDRNPDARLRPGAF